MYQINLMKKVCLLLIAALTLTSALAADDTSSKIDEYLNAHVKLDSFSGAVLAAKEGKIIISKGYGMANHELNVENSPEIKFRLGSVTKQFTAAAILLLEESGKLSTGDYLNKYIPDYPQGDKITIHHLLTHTSGVPELLQFDKFNEIKYTPTTMDELISVFKDQPLDFEPGEKFSYSNSGYVLLAAIIEKASGVSYEEFLTDNIFKPLGMQNTGVDKNLEILPGRASGYFLDKDKLVNAPYINMQNTIGGGCLYSTVGDLFIWDRAMKENKLLKPESAKKMFHIYKGNYGYGWVISDIRNKECYYHGGGIEGFLSYIMRWHEDDITLIILSNYQHAAMREVRTSLTSILFGEEYKMPVKMEAKKIDPAILRKHAGMYKLDPEGAMEITFDKDSLYIAPPGEPKLRLIPVSATVFKIREFGGELTFSVKDGETTGFVIKIGSNKMTAEKTK